MYLELHNLQVVLTVDPGEAVTGSPTVGFEPESEDRGLATGQAIDSTTVLSPTLTDQSVRKIAPVLAAIVTVRSVEMVSDIK